MLAAITAIILSVLLLAAWFRYSCGLLLQMRTCSDHAPALAAASRLSFLEIQHRLAGTAHADELAAFRSQLERDYRHVLELIRQSPGGCRHFSEAEISLLRVHYRISLFRDDLSTALRGLHSHSALLQMSHIVGFLANIAGATRASAATVL